MATQLIWDPRSGRQAMRLIAKSTTEAAAGPARIVREKTALQEICRVGCDAAEIGAATIDINDNADVVENDDEDNNDDYDLLHYEERYKVLICTRHQHAVQDAAEHLRRHHAMKSKARRRVLQKYSHLMPLPKPQDVVLPDPLGPPFTYLGTPIRAFICEEDECGFISVNRSVMAQHCNAKHAWKSTPAQRECWHDIWVQTFFGSRRQRYFSVNWTEGDENADNRNSNMAAADEAELDATDLCELGLIKDEWKERVDKHNKELDVADAETAKQDRTGWFKTTGWPEHLAGSNLRQLAHASRLPDRDEADLFRATELVEKLLEKGVTGLRTLHKETRRWLRSAQPTVIDPRPLGRLQNSDSQLRYAGYWKRFICYCLRVSKGKKALEEQRQQRRQQRRQKRREQSAAAAAAQRAQGRWEHNETGVDTDDRAAPGLGSAPDPGSDAAAADDTESDFGDPAASEVDESSSDDMTGRDEEEESDKYSGSEGGEAAGERDALHDAIRLFPWHGDQLALTERLQRSIDFRQRESGQLDILLDLCRAFILQKTVKDIYSSGLVHFLAVLGIDTEMGRLRSANDYSYMLAGMVYSVRIFAVESLLPSDKREEQGGPEIERFLAQRRAYLADGSYGPMSTMISLLAYSKSVALDHGNAGSIDWPSDDVMTLHGERIYMSRFRGMVQSVIAEAEDRLWRELMWCDRQQDRFEIALHEVEDDVTFTKRGFSFTGKPRNGLDKGLDWMLDRMMKTRAGRRLRTPNMLWHTVRVTRHLKAMEKFRELLLFLVHVTGGQPARGPEVTSLRFKNGFLQDRNIFVMSGQVATVTRYNKSQSQWDKPKVIPRFLPWRVGQLLAVYVAYVQPFRELLAVSVQGKGWTEYIWADDRGPWETDRLTAIIKRETAKALGVRLTTHLYRHAAAAIGRKKVGVLFAKGYKEAVGEGDGEEEEEEEEDEDPNELAAGRGSRVGGNRYGVSSSIVKHLSLRSIDTFRPLCEKWHAFLGLESYGPDDEEGRKRGKGKRKRETLESDGGVDVGGEGRSVDEIKRRSGETVMISEFRAGINRVLAQMSWQQRAQMQQQADDNWFEGPTRPMEENGAAMGAVGLGIGGSSDSVMPTPRVQTVYESSPMAATAAGANWQSTQLSGTSLMTTATTTTTTTTTTSGSSRLVKSISPRPSGEELQRAMAMALGLDDRTSSAVVGFRSKQQEEAMKAVLEYETPLVVVLPTGGGKSLLFMVPACLERDVGMTLVVVPYRQLINEFLKRARSVGIDCEEWKSGTTDPAALMVVSADALANRRFLDFGARMRSKGILRRAFVDECHLAFTANSWRGKLVHMKRIRSLGVPTVFLTATLPPTLEYDFEESMALQYARYIRASTVRASTRYMVHGCKRGELLKTVAESCRRRGAHFRQGEKGVVYCKSQSETELLAEELGCGFVHAGNSGDDIMIDGGGGGGRGGGRNGDVIAEWLERGGFVVATSALGTGVDYPNIVFVLHAGIPYGMIDYAQESGRAGRGGEEVSSVIIIEEGAVERQEAAGRVRSVDERAMVEYLKTEGCRRAVLGGYFDRDEIVCDDRGGMVRCDRCGEGEEDIRRSDRVMAEDFEMVEEALDEMASGCTTCWLADVLGRDGAEDGGVEWEHRGWTGRVYVEGKKHMMESLERGERECEGEEWEHAEKRREGVEEELDCEAAKKGMERAEAFRRRVRFERDTHSCWKCGFSQKLCKTGIRAEQRCQWPYIAMSVALAACRNVKGRGIIRRAGFRGSLGTGENWGDDENWEKDLGEYAQWLGQRHKARIWEEVVSNCMAVVLEFMIWSRTV